MRFPSTSPSPTAGRSEGITAHDAFDSALGTCKAMDGACGYANRKQIPVDDIRVTVDPRRQPGASGRVPPARDAAITGALTDAQRRELLAVAEKCPVHKLMTQAKTEIGTELAPIAA
jgi:putative redox protein